MSLALVVDDHPEATYLLRCLLEADGFQVLEAHNGREALAAAHDKPLDLIVSDILMPVMDGFSFCRACKSDPRLQAVPFIFYTATYVDKRDEELALSLGADLFLIKPAEPEVLMQNVRDVLSRRRAGTQAPQRQATAETPFLQQYSEVLIHKLEDKLEELEKANQSLRLKDFALASSPSGILFLEAGRDICYANPGLVRMTGKNADAILGKPAAGLFAEPAAFERWFADAQAGACEMLLATTASSPIWVRIEKHSIRGENGSPLGTMLSCTDVTEERHLRRELARSQRLESLSLFAAGVAHDFNNLLMGIFALLDQDTSHASSEEDREATRTTAHAAFERARELTRRLLTFARGTPSERRPTDLREIVEESILLSLTGSAVRCERRYCAAPALAIVDPGEMAQVVSNLLVNARQAMDHKGSMVVSVALNERPAGAAPGTGRTVQVTIADHGPGIPPESLDKIFEPYFTTKKDGRGLGLATSHAIITEHGGQISVTSRPAAGTTFVIGLPAADATTSATPPRSSAKPVRAHGARVLVMDDEIAIQSLLKQGLERVGYAVVAVANGEQALLEFARARSEGLPFDLAVLDLTVKGGMGGIDTVQALRRADPKLLAIATTGYGERAQAPDLQSCGFARVLAKPFLIHELCATISAVLP